MPEIEFSGGLGETVATIEGFGAEHSFTPPGGIGLGGIESDMAMVAQFPPIKADREILGDRGAEGAVLQEGAISVSFLRDLQRRLRDLGRRRAEITSRAALARDAAIREVERLDNVIADLARRWEALRPGAQKNELEQKVRFYDRQRSIAEGKAGRGAQLQGLATAFAALAKRRAEMLDDLIDGARKGNRTKARAALVAFNYLGTRTAALKHTRRAMIEQWKQQSIEFKRAQGLGWFHKKVWGGVKNAAKATGRGIKKGVKAVGRNVAKYGKKVLGGLCSSGIAGAAAGAAGTAYGGPAGGAAAGGTTGLICNKFKKGGGGPEGEGGEEGEGGGEGGGAPGGPGGLPKWVIPAGIGAVGLVIVAVVALRR